MGHGEASSGGNRRLNRGFTLIELIVTVSIAAILLALAIPSFREVLLNNQRASRVNALMADLNFARAQAVGIRRRVTLCRTDDPTAEVPVCLTGNGWEEGWVIFVDGNDDGNFDGTDDVDFDRDGNGSVEALDAVLRRHGGLISPDEQALPDAKKFTLRGNGVIANRVSYRASGLANAGTFVACDPRGFSKGRAVVIAAGGRVQSMNANDPRVLADDVTTCQH